MFTQKSEINQIEVMDDHGVEAELNFSNGDFEVMFYDDHEFMIDDEITKSIYLKIKGVFYVVADVIHMARMSYESICAETLADEENERAMRAELSSPRATGRI